MNRKPSTVHAVVDCRWLSLQEAADACRVAYRIIYRTVQRGELEAEKREGRPYRLRRSDVEAFIDRSRVRPGELASAAPRTLSRREAKP